MPTLLELIRDTNTNEALAMIQTGNFNPEQVDNNGYTALMLACEKKMPDVAMALIQTGQSKPEQVNIMGNTALIHACINRMTNVALALIQTGQSKPEHVNNNGMTALIWACNANMPEVAMALIQTGQSKPEQVNKDGITALILACQNNMPEVAMALIQTGQSKPEQVNKIENTALILACYNKLSEVAIALIQTGQSKPEQVNAFKDTALIWACNNKMSEVAMSLIQTGQSKPEHVNKDGNTALILACKNKMSEVAMALIQTGQSNPGHGNRASHTALMIACQNEMSDVALALIQTGQSNHEHLNYKALQIAENNNMNEVVAEILKLKNPVIDNKFYIDTTKEGFDSIHQETIIIQEYLKYANNLCFKVGPQCFLINRDDLKRQLDDKQFHKFECKQAGNSSQYILDNNIKRDIRYFISTVLFGMRFLVKMDDLKNIMDNSSKLYTNLYSVMPTGQILPAIISQEFIDGGGGMSADHCQTRKEIEVYKIVVAYPLPCPLSEQAREQVSVSAIEQEESINILYKNNTYKLPINMNTLIGELKTQLLNTLLEKGVISSINQNVKFLFGGKVYMDNAIPISQITNPPFGKTLNAMINPIQGGTKKHKHPKNHKHKTKKQKRNTKKQKRKYTKKHKKHK